MKILIEATKDVHKLTAGGITQKVRLWRGTTQGGVPIDAYVLTILPQDKNDMLALKLELPKFMGVGNAGSVDG